MHTPVKPQINGDDDLEAPVLGRCSVVLRPPSQCIDSPRTRFSITEVKTLSRQTDCRHTFSRVDVARIPLYFNWFHAISTCQTLSASQNSSPPAKREVSSMVATKDSPPNRLFGNKRAPVGGVIAVRWVRVVSLRRDLGG
jgi:hypothetical protein